MIVKKIAMAGAYGVGKTSLVKRFVESIFDERYLTTVGVKVDKKKLSVAGRDLTLMIWDLAGEDEFTALRLSYLRGASGYLLVMDGCRRSTFTKAAELQQRIASEFGPLPFLAVINKSDIAAAWEYTRADVDALGWPVVETSAKSGGGVDGMFASIAAQTMRDGDD